MTLAIIDVQTILLRSVAGAIAREIRDETAETAGRGSGAWPCSGSERGGSAKLQRRRDDHEAMDRGGRDRAARA